MILKVSLPTKYTSAISRAFDSSHEFCILQCGWSFWSIARILNVQIRAIKGFAVKFELDVSRDNMGVCPFSVDLLCDRNEVHGTSANDVNDLYSSLVTV